MLNAPTDNPSLYAEKGALNIQASLQVLHLPMLAEASKSRKPSDALIRANYPADGMTSTIVAAGAGDMGLPSNYHSGALAVRGEAVAWEAARLGQSPADQLSEGQFDLRGLIRLADKSP